MVIVIFIVHFHTSSNVSGPMNGVIVMEITSSTSRGSENVTTKLATRKTKCMQATKNAKMFVVIFFL